jgi:hypothetical protein
VSGLSGLAQPQSRGRAERSRTAYANWVTFNAGSGKRQQAEEMGKSFRPAFEKLRSFERVMFLGNDKSGEYGALVLWETNEDAEAVFQAMTPNPQEAVKGKVKEPPKRVQFEVIMAWPWVDAQQTSGLSQPRSSPGDQHSLSDA